MPHVHQSAKYTHIHTLHVCLTLVLPGSLSHAVILSRSLLLSLALSHSVSLSLAFSLSRACTLSLFLSPSLSLSHTHTFKVHGLGVIRDIVVQHSDYQWALIACGGAEVVRAAVRLNPDNVMVFMYVHMHLWLRGYGLVFSV